MLLINKHLTFLILLAAFTINSNFLSNKQTQFQALALPYNNSDERYASAKQQFDNDSQSRPKYGDKFVSLKKEIPENTPTGSKIIEIQLLDYFARDEKVLHGLSREGDASLFSLRVDETSHIIELINEIPFDYETKKAYQVVITVASIRMRLEAIVDVLIKDMNDNIPLFDDFSIIVNNYKTYFPTTPIGRVPATDNDVSDQLRYRALSRNNAEYIFVNETSGLIQLSPGLNSDVTTNVIFDVAVSDGTNEVVKQCGLTVNLITETMLQNSVLIRIRNTSREEFLSNKFETFVASLSYILAVPKPNIVIFNIEETYQEYAHADLQANYRYNLTSDSFSKNISLVIHFSVRSLEDGSTESFLSPQYVEETIYMKKLRLINLLKLDVDTFQDSECVNEPCRNYQDCQTIYKFSEASNFVTAKNILFRPIKAVQSYTCLCPPTYTSMTHRSECDLQFDPCFSNPCLNDGICRSHESGFTCECKPDFLGKRCELSFANSTCSSHQTNTYPFSRIKTNNICAGDSKCINLNRPLFKSPKSLSVPSIEKGVGFKCQDCQNQLWSNNLCQLRARSFNRSSYIVLPSLRKRHKFVISFQFVTVHPNSLIMYNGRYNEKHDFISLDIINSYVRFRYSLGSDVNQVVLDSIRVSDGNWHKVVVEYNRGNVTLMVDDCDPVLDEALYKMYRTSKRCSNTSIIDHTRYRSLDLTSPMFIGSLSVLPTEEFRVSNSDGFIGCINDLNIDYQLVDMNSVVHDVGTLPGCPERRSFCQQISCNGHQCQDSWGAAKCLCGEDYVGKNCGTLINNERVRRFSGNSYLSFSPLDASIALQWNVSLYFKTMNPNGVLMKIGFDPEASLIMELSSGAIKLSNKNHLILFNIIPLDDGEWHHIELTLSTEYTNLQIDHNPTLSIRSTELNFASNTVVTNITLGASFSRSIDNMPDNAPVEYMANVPDSSAAEIQTWSSANNNTSFNGCIYGVSVGENSELWLQSSTNEERNVDRGCVMPDICESGYCPPNSKCIRKGMTKAECICNPGFVGDKCIPVCDLNLCQGEKSKCVPVGAENDLQVPLTNSKYKCICEPLRSGKNCEHQLTEKCPSNWWGSPIHGGQASNCGPCNCDESKGFDGDCDKITGRCICKAKHYQPEGSDRCIPCDCYDVGSLFKTIACNQTTGQCDCRPSVIGRRCDTCASPVAEVTPRGCEVVRDACPKTFSDGIWWDRTAKGTAATHACPSSSEGTATRFCDLAGDWQKPNLFDCISNSMMDLFTQFRLFDSGMFQLEYKLAKKTASNLKDALNETISTSGLLYGSDIYISFRLLHHLISYETLQTGLNMTHKQDRMYIRNLVESASYILDPEYAELWPLVAKRPPYVGAEHILRLFDSYAKTLIDNQFDAFTQPFEISSKYFTFGMDTLSTDQLWDVDRILKRPPSPPYVSGMFDSSQDSYGTASNSLDQDLDYIRDGKSEYLQQTSTTDFSVLLPKYNNYATRANSMSRNTDPWYARTLIPLKTLGVKPLIEVIPKSIGIKDEHKNDMIRAGIKSTKQNPAIVVYSIFKTLGPLLPSNYDNTVHSRFGLSASTNSPVVWLTVKSANSSEFSPKYFQPKINYMLKITETSGRTRPQCAVWNFDKNQSKNGTGKGRFSTRGCQVLGVLPNHKLKIKYDYVNCSCDHLGAVAVLMDNTYFDYLTDDTNIKDIAMTVSLAISLVVLMITLLVLTCGHSIKSNSNSINKNILIVLMLIELLLLYAISSRGSIDQREYDCKLIAVFLHYFSISLFAWLLVNVVHLYRMLTELKAINHGPMKSYHIVGYAVPGFFVSIAVGLRIEQFGSYLFCWLSIHEPIIWSMFGPISFISALIFILYILAFYKSSSIRIEPSAESIIKNVIWSNTIKTPTIGIYWIVSVYAVNEALLDYVYLFPAVTIIKSLVLFVLLCIIDKPVRYNLYVSWLKLRGHKMPELEDDEAHWNENILGSPTLFVKNSPYIISANSGSQVRTPGFQSSATDMFDAGLALSIASTTSESSDSEGTSSNNNYKHRHSNELDYNHDRSTYGRRGKDKYKKRSHKRSHHKHHHRRSRDHHDHSSHYHHHHHHHHHKSRHNHSRHQEYDGPYEETGHLNYDYESTRLANSNGDEHLELASSHSSDDFSTLPKSSKLRGGRSRTSDTLGEIEEVATSKEATAEIHTPVQATAALATDDFNRKEKIYTNSDDVSDDKKQELDSSTTTDRCDKFDDIRDDKEGKQKKEAQSDNKQLDVLHAVSGRNNNDDNDGNGDNDDDANGNLTKISE